MTAEAALEGKTCVVTGGGGFLGHHLCQALLDTGANVRVYGRTRYFPGQLSDVEWHEGELEDSARLSSVVNGGFVVFHLAGTSAPAIAEANPGGSLHRNVDDTLNVLKACQQAGIERVVFPSSGGTVYGAAQAPEFSEDMVPEPIGAYGITKLTIEHLLQAFNHTHGMRNITLRIANPFGPFQHGRKNQGAIAIFARKALADQSIQIWGDGTVVRDYVAVADVARAMVMAASYSGRRPVFNIGSGIGRNLIEIVDTLRDILNKEIAIEFLPGRSFDISRSVLDCSLAKKELGWWASADWQASVRETCDWLKSQDV